MRARALLTLPLLLAALTACGGEEPPAPPTDAVALDTIGRGDLCGQLTASVLNDLTGEEFGEPQVSEERAGRHDGCSSGSGDSGISVTVEVWDERDGNLAADIRQLGSPAATTTTTPATVEGHDAITAVATLEDRLLADLVLYSDDRILVVLAQRYESSADGTTPEDQLDLAERIAERLLPT